MTLGLYMHDIARDGKRVNEALNFTMEVIQLIKYSPK